jgi:hypothetical protein
MNGSKYLTGMLVRVVQIDHCSHKNHCFWISNW